MKHTPTLPYATGSAASRTGPRHTSNEDQYRILDVNHLAVAAFRKGTLFAVADGVSTSKRGKYAAELMCSRIDTFFDRFQAPRVESLMHVVTEVDWELRGLGHGQAACTVSLLWLAYGMANVVHVGDSQLYRVRHGECTRITQNHRGGRSLGAYVGMGPEIGDVMQVWQEPLFVGDLFLIVTDGVTEVISPDELIEEWWTGGGSTQRAATSIINEVNRRGGQDDATAVVVDVLAVEADSAEETTFSGRTDFVRQPT